MAPVDGPRRDYNLASSGGVQDPAFNPDSKSGLGRRVSERLFASNAPALLSEVCPRLPQLIQIRFQKTTATRHLQILRILQRASHDRRHGNVVLLASLVGRKAS